MQVREGRDTQSLTLRPTGFQLSAMRVVRRERDVMVVYEAASADEGRSLVFEVGATRKTFAAFPANWRKLTDVELLALACV